MTEQVWLSLELQLDKLQETLFGCPVIYIETRNGTANFLVA